MDGPGSREEVAGWAGGRLKILPEEEEEEEAETPLHLANAGDGRDWETLPFPRSHAQSLPVKQTSRSKEPSQTLLQKIKLWGWSPIWVEELEEFPKGQAGRGGGREAWAPVLTPHPPSVGTLPTTSVLPRGLLAPPTRWGGNGVAAAEPRPGGAKAHSLVWEGTMSLCAPGPAICSLCHWPGLVRVHLYTPTPAGFRWSQATASG